MSKNIVVEHTDKSIEELLAEHERTVPKCKEDIKDPENLKEYEALEAEILKGLKEAVKNEKAVEEGRVLIDISHMLPYYSDETMNVLAFSNYTVDGCDIVWKWGWLNSVAEHLNEGENTFRLALEAVSLEDLTYGD